MLSGGHTAMLHPLASPAVDLSERLAAAYLATASGSCTRTNLQVSEVCSKHGRPTITAACSRRAKYSLL